MNLSNEGIKGLAELERKMSDGRQPYVCYGGHRMAVMPEVMEIAGLESGQSISDALFYSIQELSLGQIRAKIQLRDILSNS